MEEEKQQKLFDNRKLAALLIPLAVDQLLNSFMGTVDTLVVSNLGSAAISAVSLVDSINILIVQAFFALATGGTVVCSHYLGCRREDHAKEAARQLVFITFMMSLVIGVLCIAFNGQILSLIFGEVEDAVMENAKQYFFFSAISYPFIALYDDGSSILRAQENSRLPMMISVASNLVNLVLNLLFVWGLGFGVAGSACATLLARIFAMAVVMYKLRNPRLTVSLTQYHSIRPDWGEIRRILRIGIPSGVENSMFQFGKLAIQSTVSLMGTAAIAAQGMTNIIENLNGILAIGVGIGLMTVVGETLGAGRKEEAVYYVKKLCVISEVVIIVSCLVMFALVHPITYFGGMEPESARMCIHMVTWITIVKPVVWVMSFIPAYGFRAAGDVKFTMTVSVISMWFCRVTLAIVLARVFGMGPMAVWIGMFTDWTVRGVIYTVRFRSRRWLGHQVI
ncbi:MATE family efflux transporter [Mediterraneibacter glycyrrhizinilyticus]|uniref:MATE family efflux transporter n=1 Tax=Mediterraneibacter glycyrrhizinilyticus TaxID=342942 RepID=UPI00195FFE80|nr:MATE family efflux transporter [Mediterraneibacter glycyrrhizinilyticus]MBM6752192.1 MATE family efflux transporter [Mediterraneibacter glycyrrhizinilyticus]